MTAQELANEIANWQKAEEGNIIFSVCTDASHPEGVYPNMKGTHEQMVNMLVIAAQNYPFVKLMFADTLKALGEYPISAGIRLSTRIGRGGTDKH
ncbi:MAG: hypothetical protein ACI30A_06540 [Paludibacteraceae bacterium]